MKSRLEVNRSITSLGLKSCRNLYDIAPSHLALRSMINTQYLCMLVYNAEIYRYEEGVALLERRSIL